MRLQTLRIACYNEVKRGEKLNAETVKQISGEVDSLVVRGLWGAEGTIKPRAKLVFTMPEGFEGDEALLDRLIYVPFPHRFARVFGTRKRKNDERLQRLRGRTRARWTKFSAGSWTERMSTTTGKHH